MNLFLKILPLVLQAILGFEQALPQTGQGATKKQLVLAGVQAAIGTAETAAPEVMGKVSTWVDDAVTILNNTGVLKKSR